MTHSFVYLSGLPRSGSQVLSSMLNQHPSIHSTPTSPVADLVSVVSENWFNVSGAIHNRNPQQYGNIINGVIEGAFKHIEEPVIVDKNRLWPRFVPDLTQAFGQNPKIICTVRDIAEIVSSYILLIRKNAGSVSFIDKDLAEMRLPANDKNRCKLIIERYIMHPYTSLRKGVNSDADLLFLNYRDIVENSQITMDLICEFASLPLIKVELDNLQPMEENDQHHGGLVGLHEVRSTMKRVSKPPEEVIGHELTNLCYSYNLEFWNNDAGLWPNFNSQHCK